MKIRCLLITLQLIFVCVNALSQSSSDLLNRWQPREPIESDSATIINCFTSSPIPDSVFCRMFGKSFKKDCTVSRDSLRYLTIPHHDGHGKILMGEMVCDKNLADDILAIFKEAFLIEYPIEKIILIDNFDADDILSMNANNTSCFNYRTVGNSSKLSKHALGRAVDINPLYNPYVKTYSRKNIYVSPESGRKYIDRKLNFPYKITIQDPLCQLFIKHGFTWGGNWHSLKDYQHFEK